MRRALPARRTCVNLAAMNRARTRRQFLRLLAGPPLLAAAPARMGRQDSPWRRQDRADRAADRGGAGAAERLAADRFHFRQAARRPLPGQHADRRSEASGEIRRPRRCVRLRHVLRGGAGGGHRPRHRRNSRPSLRRIRYDHGKVQYDQRNHYFADWCKRNIENGICRPVAIEPSVVIDKTAHLAPRVRQAPGVDRRDRQGDAAGQAPSCWRRATSSASRRGARASITITPASSHSARTANCCCATPRKAAAASSRTRWRHSSPPIR